MSDPDFFKAMKRILFSPFSGRRLGKSLVVSTLLLSLGATFSVQSAIRILGPQEESPPPTAAEPLSPRTAPQTSTVNRRQSVGPTTDADTLWSIATRYQPNNNVTVYQTLGAIFRLNPNAFENANIHGLVPGSTLLLPTLTEIRRESTDDVARRLQLDQARKDAQRVANRPLSEQVPPAPATTPAPVAKPAPAITTPATEEKAQPEMAQQPAEQETAKTEPMKPDMIPEKPDMSTVQAQINESDLQMGKLVESNHILKIRLAEVQNELAALKEQMTADEELTGEIRQFLEMQRARQAQMEMKQPSFLESLMASPLMLATLAIIPALLVIGAAAFFIMRRRKDDENVAEPEGLDGEEPDMPVIMVPEEDDDSDELILEDDELEVTDDIDADDLFGDDMMDSGIDDINLSDSLELSDDEDEGGLDLDADTDLTSALDAALDDDFSSDLDVEPSTDGAIGLEDMERALDEMSMQPQESELSPDEALAAMWEQSLAGGDDADVDDIDALLAAEQSGDETPAEVPQEEEAVAAEEESEPETNEALFDKLMDDEPEVDLSQDIDLADDDIDDLLADVPAGEKADEEVLAEDPTAMLDEFLNDEDFGFDKEDEAVQDEETIDPDALLDEMLDDELLDENGNPVEAEKDDSDLLALEDAAEEDISDSDALLDELLGDDDQDPLDESALLDESVDEDDLIADLIDEPEEDVDLADTDVLLDELVDEDEELSLDDESALLDELPEDDLDDDLFALDNEAESGELNTDEALLAPEGDNSDELELPGSDGVEEPESSVDPAESDVNSSDEASEDALSDLDALLEDDESVSELEEMLDETAEQDVDVPEASDSDLDLLDDVLELSDEPEALTEEVAEEASPEVEAEPEASQEDLDLLDSLLDGEDPEAVVEETQETALDEEPVGEEIPAETETDSDEQPVDETALQDSELDTEGLTETEAEEASDPEPEAAEETVDADAVTPDVETPEAQAPEFSEPDVEALDSEESEEAEAVPEEALSQDETVSEEDEPLDLSALPEYDEQAALQDSELEPQLNSDEEPVADEAGSAPLDLSDFPEYTEEDAAQEFDAEDVDLTSPASEVESFDESDIEEASTAESMADEDYAEEAEALADSFNAQDDALPADEALPAFTATENNTLAFPPVDAISLDELGEFDEDDALSAALDEQREMEEFLPQSKGEGFSQPTPPVSQPYRAVELDELAELDDDEHQVAGLNMDALLSEPLEEDEFGLGDFETEALDIPEDESDIWSAEQEPEPELESEDWSEQPEILGDDIKSMDLDADLEGLLGDAESELVEESSSDDGYISIDELMKDDGTPQEDPDSLKMDLNVGLEDFPDVLSDIHPADVDSSGEAATNMDLAKAYLEMNDVDGALQLLEKVMQGDDNKLKEEARLMIEHLN